MRKSIFQNVGKTFSVIMFIQEDTLRKFRPDIEAIGNQRNVKLVVQPCPYEGIEFLYHAELDFPNGHISEEKDFFWHALELKRNLPMDILDNVSAHHHRFLVSILQNDSKQVTSERKELESLILKNS